MNWIDEVFNMEKNNASNEEYGYFLNRRSRIGFDFFDLMREFIDK